MNFIAETLHIWCCGRTNTYGHIEHIHHDGEVCHVITYTHHVGHVGPPFILHTPLSQPPPRMTSDNNNVHSTVLVINSQGVKYNIS